MTDQEAVELLKLLARYCQLEEAPPDVAEIRLRELAGDLYDSLPLQLSRDRDVLEAARVCRADALTLPREWRGGAPGVEPDAPPTLSKPSAEDEGPPEPKRRNEEDHHGT